MYVSKSFLVANIQCLKYVFWILFSEFIVWMTKSTVSQIQNNTLWIMDLEQTVNPYIKWEQTPNS